MLKADGYFYDDSDSYTLEFSENEIKVIRSDKKESILFTLKPYQLNGKDFVFLEINDFGEGINLERMVTPLENILLALLANKFFHIIFSFKGVLYLSDLALSMLPFYMQDIVDNGGRIFFCNVNSNIFHVVELMGFDKVEPDKVAWYSSETEMLEKVPV